MLPMTAATDLPRGARLQSPPLPTRAQTLRLRLSAALATLTWIVICLHPVALIALSFYWGWL